MRHIMPERKGNGLIKLKTGCVLSQAKREKLKDDK